jgi:hypothetical protein
MTTAQLYLWSGARAQFLETHRFYVEQMKERILSQFDDLKGQADRYSEEVYQRLGKAHGNRDGDPAELAEAAYDEGVAHYVALHELRKQVLLGGLAGMYHAWDKTVREYLEQELRHHLDMEKLEGSIWKATVGELLDVFEQFGWPVKSHPCWRGLDALGLVVNVYKHGKGRSLSELKERHPDYVVDPLKEWTPEGMEFGPDPEWLTVTDEQFDGFADAIRDFWIAMPERLYYELPAVHKA